MMRTLKRIGASIVASFDTVVSQVENHESVVNCAIREVQETGARAKLQLNRVRQDGQSMRKRLLELREQTELWQERAKKTADIDEKKALECLRRKRRLEKSIADLEVQEREHARFEKQLSADLIVIDEKVVRLKQQRNVLRTRQSRAEAMKLLQADDSSLVTEIDDILERWEIRVGEYEAQSTALTESTDDLAEDYSIQEEESSLKEELSKIVAASI
jgi:phage shock protein A